jgi:hypothetical protein
VFSTVAFTCALEVGCTPDPVKRSWSSALDDGNGSASKWNETAEVSRVASSSIGNAHSSDVSGAQSPLAPTSPAFS